MRKKILCIELIGIWGSGKTTLIRNVNSLLNDSGVSSMCYDDFVVLRRRKRYFEGFLYAITSPLAFSKFFYFLVKIFIKLRPFDKFQFEIFLTFVKVYLAKRILLSKNPDVLMWEGDFHLLTMFIKMKKLSTKDFLAASGVSKNNHHILLPVFINVADSIAKNRVIADQNSGFFRFSNVDIKLLDERYKYVTDNQSYLTQTFNDESIHHAIVKGDNLQEKNSKELFFLINKIRDFL